MVLKLNYPPLQRHLLAKLCNFKVREEFGKWGEDRGQSEDQLREDMKRMLAQLREGFATREEIIQIKTRYAEQVSETDDMKKMINCTRMI